MPRKAPAQPGWFVLVLRRVPSSSPQTVAEPHAVAQPWALPSAELLKQLGSGTAVLSTSEAATRLVRYGANALREQATLSHLRVIWDQLKSPLLLLLIFAIAVSLLVAEWTDA
jgi:Mg2+-importing ATPase